VADWNPDRFGEVSAWPLRDLFLAYLHRMKRDARRNYEIETLVWAILNPHRRHPEKPPQLPAILRG
jgi:hypothetical protein